MIKTKLLTPIGITVLLLLSHLAYANHSNPNNKIVNITTETKALHAVAPTLKPQVLKLALNAYNKAQQQGLGNKLGNKPIFTVIDYSLADTKKRMWVFDLQHNNLLYNTLVAHGKGSGDVYSKRFSNAWNSKATSLGLFLTKNTYYGSDGYSLRLQGLSGRFNNKAYKRIVVFHGAWYVSDTFVRKYHRLGRSWGCQALSKKMIKPVVDNIKDGTLVFAYGNDKDWLAHGPYLQA